MLPNLGGKRTFRGIGELVGAQPFSPDNSGRCLGQSPGAERGFEREPRSVSARNPQGRFVEFHTLAEGVVNHFCDVAAAFRKRQEVDTGHFLAKGTDMEVVSHAVEVIQDVGRKPVGRCLCLTSTERVKGIEPSSQAWEARILPLNHTRCCRPIACHIRRGDAPLILRVGHRRRRHVRDGDGHTLFPGILSEFLQVVV